MGNGRFENLTPREQECLRLVAKDRDSGEIATILNIGTETVESHIKRARGKLGGVSRFEAARAFAEFESRPHPMVTPPLVIEISEIARHSVRTDQPPPSDWGVSKVEETRTAFVHADPLHGTVPPASPTLIQGVRNAQSYWERLGLIGSTAVKITGGFATLLLALYLFQRLSYLAANQPLPTP